MSSITDSNDVNFCFRFREFQLYNGLLSSKQYGFIKNRSTSLQLLQIVDMWTVSEDVMYIDFEKGFDKVPHKRLISKLRSYGINDIIIMCGLHRNNICAHRTLIYFSPVSW